MDTVLRVLVVYVFIFVGLRILGKRELGQLSPFELVTLLIIPELVSPALTRQETSLTNALIGVATLLTIVFISSAIMHVNPTFEKIAMGEPTVLVEHGHLLPSILNKERISPDEIYNAMHLSGLDQLAQVRWAILETDGKIAIIPETRVLPAAGRALHEGDS